MKMLFVCFFALVITASAFAQGSYDATGAVKYQKKSFEGFVNSASAALTVGEGVCLDLGENQDDGIAIDYCITGFPPMGIIADTSCAVGARCKVQVKGVFEAAVLDVTQGSAVAGSSAYVHSDGSLYGDTTDTDKQPVGIFLDAATASGTIQVFINP